MIRRIPAFVGAAIVALLIAFILRRRPADSAGVPEAAGRHGAASASADAPTAGAETAGKDPAAAAGTSKKRRGLWLLTPDPNAPTPPEHPWIEYIRKRDAVRAAWAAANVSLHLDDASLSTLQGSFGASSGLVLRLDPAVAAINQGVTFQIQDLAADQGLTLLAMASGTRATVGTDGFMWLVPATGRAACEPEFAEELAAWESGSVQVAGRHAPFRPSSKLQAGLRTKRSIEIVRKPLADAVDEIGAAWGVRIKSSVWNDLREHTGPGEEFPATADAPAHYPSQTPVTLIRDEITLEEALAAVLAAEGLVGVPNGDFFIVCSKHDLLEIDAVQDEDADFAATLRKSLVRLDGSPLDAEAIAASATQQAGLCLRADPLLRTCPARWAAVEAELTLGEVLETVARETGSRVEFHPEHWPAPRPQAGAGDLEKPDSWTVWIVVDRWAAPPGIK